MIGAGGPSRPRAPNAGAAPMETNRHSEPGWVSRNRLRIAPWIFLIPALVFFAIYIVLPIFQSFWLSLYEWNGLYDADGNSAAT